MGDAVALITPEYRALQIQLHATGEYGRGVDAQECADAIRKIAPAGASVLDYGCGSGHLKKLLTGYDVREYDPCIEGKDGRPEPADYVVCADVLEHIEPDLLDTVLGHLMEVTREQLIVVIATKPSKKLLADGRNAHLIVENADWWKDRFYRFCRMERWDNRDSEGRGIFGIGRPVFSADQFKAVAALSDGERNEYVRQNVTQSPRRIPAVPLPPHGNFAILCGYGPSIRESLEHLDEQRKTLPGAQVISVSGAHDYICKRGIIPDWHVECDPRPHKSLMLKKLRKKTKYLMASCCHPDLIKRIADDKKELILWHMFNGEESLAVRDIPGESPCSLIPGGGSVLLRTLVLFYFLGYRNFVIHGFDCSYAPDGKTHAGKHSGKEPLKVVDARPEGSDRWFKTAAVMVTYANHMIRDIADGRFPDCRFHFMGDGMFQEMLRMYLNSPMVPRDKPTHDYFNMQRGDNRPEESFTDNKDAA